MLEDITVKKITNLLEKIENPNLKVLIAKAVKNWQTGKTSPGPFDFGIKTNLEGIYEPISNRSCLIGSSLIGEENKDDLSPSGDSLVIDEFSSKIFGLSDRYIEELEGAFDVGSHSMLLGEDYEVFIEIRNCLKNDSNSLFRKNENI